MSDFSTVVAEILGATSRAIGSPGSSPISLHEPELGEKEIELVLDCLRSGWVSSVGAYVDRFETELAREFQVKRAVAVANGTAALHVCLILAGVKPGDEVLMPTMSFVATANAAVHAGGVPHFIDSEGQSLGVDCQKLSHYFGQIAEKSADGWRNRLSGRRIGALVVMHCFGHPVDIDGFLAFSADTGIPLVEDAAESIGTLYKGRPTGSFGKLSCVSFNGNKIITTGGGGAILTNDEELGREAKHITTTAKVPHRWEFNHDRVAFNYRLPNINAALGCAQLLTLRDKLQRKRQLAEVYRQEFMGVAGASFFSEPSWGRSNYWLNTILLSKRSREARDELLKKGNEAGFGMRPAWTLLHRLPMFLACAKSDLSFAEDLEDRIVNLPSSPSLWRKGEYGA